MRQSGTAVAAVVVGSVLLVVGTGCAASGTGLGSEPSDNTSSGSASEAGATNDANGTAQGEDGGATPAPEAGSGADSGTGDAPIGSRDAGSDAPSAASPFSCTGAGIAAYADALVASTRQSCTADGIGVVDDKDYSCMQAPIQQLNPPYAGASYDIVSTLLYGNTQYPFLECTYFVQAVTAGVCGAPISPPSTPWTSYPLAYTFAGQNIPGYTWIPNGQGDVQVGDIHVYGSSFQGDPGHIMIVAAVVDSTHFRLAEANELNPDGSDATMETGVVSNTRIDSLDNALLAGWFRVTGTAGDH
jgi:hypothetical protein